VEIKSQQKLLLITGCLFVCFRDGFIGKHAVGAREQKHIVTSRVMFIT